MAALIGFVPSDSFDLVGLTEHAGLAEPSIYDAFSEIEVWCPICGDYVTSDTGDCPNCGAELSYDEHGELFE